jgi:hypothetical protein
MLTSSNHKVRQIDLDLIGFYFDAKASMLEELEDHTSGMFSTQQNLIEAKRQLINFITAEKSKNSIFYLYLDEVKEENLRVVVPTTNEKDDLTREFIVILHENGKTEIAQGSLSGKVLTIIKTFQ